MKPSTMFSCPVQTKKKKYWPYYEYYLGEKDTDDRRNGDGRNYWTGAESMEWYTGRFVRNIMHGAGEYRWRWRGEPGLFVTYEGNFYVNSMHGYGAMSYPDGKVFTGLFNDNVRYGPGVESLACRAQNVGLWRGGRLVRLAWRPTAPSVVPELGAAPAGKALVEQHRLVLKTTYVTIGKANPAGELLKELGCDPVVAAKDWKKLYPKLCTDTASQLCHVDLFKQNYYNGRIYSLKLENSDLEPNEEDVQDDGETEERGPYYAWNNDEAVIDMMKHCFKHDQQRTRMGVDLMSVLSGPRRQFLRPAIHELDSRTLLMAIYLGHIASTTFLINERGVDPNVADMQGNSAVVYATCGDQASIINFLVEAGADVDSYNDACCTALGIALMRFTCAQRDIPITGIVRSVLPPPVTPAPAVQRASEWNMTRELPPPPSPAQPLLKSPSKFVKPEKSFTRRDKSLASLKDGAAPKKKESSKSNEQDYESDESINEVNKLYKDINFEYICHVNDLFLQPCAQAAYLFEVYDMVNDIVDDEKVVPEKSVKKMPSKILKETNKPSKEVISQTVDNDHVSLTSVEKTKIEVLERIKSTIVQLLEKGANPNLVVLPQPALIMAVVANCPALVRDLIQYGANTDVFYPQLNDYSLLELAVAQPLSSASVEIIRALLEGDARADRRLRYVVPATATEPEHEIPGPTLLHALIARKVESDHEEDIRKQIMKMLCEYNCDVLAQFKGRSAFDCASRSMELLDIVVRSPDTDLNAAINDSNQTILVKMFTFPYFRTIDSNDRLQMLTNLLVFGADPLVPCNNGQDEYANLFILAEKILSDLEGPTKQPAPAVAGNNDKGKKEPKKGKSVANIKSFGKINDDVGNYKLATDLIKECARLMHIRWLQANLVKELIEVIDKYKHRHWNMILKDCKNRKVAGLWLMAPRCLEIWDVLKTTKKKIYSDNRNLKHLLSIVHFSHLRTRESIKLGPVTAAERDLINSDVNNMLHEHRMAPNFKTEMLPVQRPYVQPELLSKAESKFEVCFECATPLQEEKIICQKCKLVSFCDLTCIQENIDKLGCHPCSSYLKEKYFFSSPPMSKDRID